MKYAPLTRHLRDINISTCPMTFTEIEEIIGAPLPHSARRHRAWWSNNPGNSVMTTAWLDAGWRSSDVDMDGEKLVFRRKEEKRQRFAENAPETFTSTAPQFSFSGLPDHVMDILRIKAQLRKMPVEQYAASILTSEAQLTVPERLQLADAIRAQGPRLVGVDVPAMIREDRARA